MEEKDKIQEMEYLRKYQAQNSILAKAINHLKCELRKSKDEIISLNRQLQVEREKSIVLETEQSELFNCLESFDGLLNGQFQRSAEGYSKLSSKISDILSKNPKNRSNGLNCAFDMNFALDATNLSQIGEISTISEVDMGNEQLAPSTSKKDLDSMVLFDSDYVSDESMCQEVDDTIKLPECKMESTSADNLNECLSSRGRRVKRIHYRELPLSRKLRRNQ